MYEQSETKQQITSNSFFAIRSCSYVVLWLLYAVNWKDFLSKLKLEVHNKALQYRSFHCVATRHVGSLSCRLPPTYPLYTFVCQLRKHFTQLIFLCYFDSFRDTQLCIKVLLELVETIWIMAVSLIGNILVFLVIV